MELGLFTCGYQLTSLEQAFADAKVFGYDYIELWGGRPHAYAPDIVNGGAEAILKLAEHYDMPIRVYTPEHNAYPFNYMLGNEAQWRDCIDYLSLSIRTGATLGAKYTLISVGHGGDAPYQARHARLLATLKRLCQVAKEQRHALLIETLTPYESNTCTTLDELVRILNELDSEYVFGMCDIVAPFVQNEDPVDYQLKLKNKLRHLHIVDSDGKSCTHLIPGDGVIPLKSVLSGFSAAGYNGTATIELVTNYIDEPTKYSELAINRLKEFI